MVFEESHRSRKFGQLEQFHESARTYTNKDDPEVGVAREEVEEEAAKKSRENTPRDTNKRKKCRLDVEAFDKARAREGEEEAEAERRREGKGVKKKFISKF